MGYKRNRRLGCPNVSCYDCEHYCKTMPRKRNCDDTQSFEPTRLHLWGMGLDAVQNAVMAIKERDKLTPDESRAKFEELWARHEKLEANWLTDMRLK